MYKTSSCDYLPFKDYTDSSSPSLLVESSGCSDCTINIIKNGQFDFTGPTPVTPGGEPLKFAGFEGK